MSLVWKKLFVPSLNALTNLVPNSAPTAASIHTELNVASESKRIQCKPQSSSFHKIKQAQLYLLLFSLTCTEVSLCMLIHQTIECILLSRSIQGHRLQVDGLTISPSLMLLEARTTNLPGRYIATKFSIPRICPEIIWFCCSAQRGASYNSCKLFCRR